MGNMEKKWLDQKLREWEEKGWVTSDGASHIRRSNETDHSGISMPFLVLLSAVGLSLAGIVLIGCLSFFWYQISFAGRMGLAAGLLILSQAGVGLCLFRHQQGTWVSEAVAVIHILVLGAAIAIAVQTFYTGWDTAAYLALCALLSLPVIYLLRAAGGVVLYALTVLVWAALGGPVNAPGGAGFIWILLVPLLPFYRLLQQHGDEIRLSVYSWVLTVTVFMAFGLAALDSAYIPFLLLATLAVAIMLTGYSIDIRKAWGVPFRWFGRFAAAGSLLISSLPGAWYGISRIQGFHWTTTAVTVLLFLFIIALLVKGVKKRFWGPVFYAGIPVILAAETMLVRSGLYSSVPLLVSSVYLLFLGFYEVVQGLQDKRPNHVKFGIAVLVCLIVAALWGGSVSPLLLVVLMIILALVLLQVRRMSRSRKDTAARVQHRTGLRHKVTTVRAGQGTVRGQRRKQEKVSRENVLPKEEPVLEEKDASVEAESIPEWMKDIHMPDIPIPQEKQPDEAAHATSVIPKTPAASPFVPPVFHNPDDIPLPQPAAVPQPREQTRREPVEKRHGSPWADTVKKTKREKHFTHSPWSSEGGDK